MKNVESLREKNEVLEMKEILQTIMYTLNNKYIKYLIRCRLSFVSLDIG